MHFGCVAIGDGDNRVRERQSGTPCMVITASLLSITSMRIRAKSYESIAISIPRVAAAASANTDPSTSVLQPN